MRHRLRAVAGAIALALTVASLLAAPVRALPAGAPRTGMICTSGTVSGTIRTFSLVATTGYAQTPDGNSVFMWSYGNGDAPDNGTFQFPGPVLCANQGETVVVALRNALPVPSSVVFPGQEAVTATGGSPGTLTTEAVPGGTVTYRFVAASPGTYAYESGSDVSKQIEMGLYGAFVIRPTGHPDWAYSSGTRFDPKREYLLLLSEFDPDLHHAVETGTAYDFSALRNRYYAINGRDFPDTLQDNGVSWLPGQPYGALVRVQPYDATRNPQPALVRMVNVGALNHPYHPHGNHLTEVAQDGRELLSPTGADASSERFGETIGAGQTQDYLLSWKDVDGWNPQTKPLPVAPPNYRNVFFKDGRTWYSGSPYLGYSGTLPTGTVTQNVCGEWYFPWHSHALNEFTNFNEGFGGMATLLRVDPLGGCLAYASGTTISAGALAGGTVASLGVDDANYYQVTSATVPTPPTGQHTDWYAQFGNVAAGSTNLVATFKGRNTSTPSQTGCCATTLSYWNWTTGSWTPAAGPATVGATDSTITAPVVAAPAAFIGTGANRGQVRVRVLTTRTAGTGAFTNQANLMTLVYDAP